LAISSKLKTVLTPEVSADMASAPIDDVASSPSAKTAVDEKVWRGWMVVNALADARAARRASFRSILSAVNVGRVE